MTFIVEYIEEGSRKFRALSVECDNQEYADVEAMRQGANILKLYKVYPKKESDHAKNQINK